jgi:hypothetical protein
MKKTLILFGTLIMGLNLVAQSFIKEIEVDSALFISMEDKSNLPNSEGLEKDVFSTLSLENSLENKEVISSWSLYGVLGVRRMKVDDHLIYLRFVDDSPSKDNIATYVSLEPANTAINLGLGANVPLAENWVIHGEFAFVFGGVRGFNLDLGAGYIVEKGNFTIIPTLDLSIISASKHLGDIYNNDLFIQFDEVKMYSSIAKVYYENYTTTLKPTIQCYLSDVLPNNLQLFASLGYNLKIGASTGSLRFTGFDIDDEAVTGYKSLNSNNVKEFEVDGFESRKSIFKANGILLNIGIAKYFD